MASVTIEKEEYTSLLDTLKNYREIIDTYDALMCAAKEKKSGKIRKLWSLKDLMS
ncbi:MAG: hypothetical protein ACD_71C00227G0001 [uncultured bacterium (gcode 4)]|uniref:Uncharacterized protein n=1 Tax=uncultured bacterium (gcode 4) TaxID=1234023 RepID=K1Z4J7_9BACT|nr:MAG: hypothetical protein ACD_71C00227G0001 [uncultured bacterium (gcode 4)]